MARVRTLATALLLALAPPALADTDTDTGMDTGLDTDTDPEEVEDTGPFYGATDLAGEAGGRPQCASAATGGGAALGLLLLGVVAGRRRA